MGDALETVKAIHESDPSNLEAAWAAVFELARRIDAVPTSTDIARDLNSMQRGL